MEERGDNDDDNPSYLPHLTAIASLTASLISHPLETLPSQLENQQEVAILLQLCTLLDAYQSAPYLLDLSLESLLHPVLAQLRKFVRRPLSTVQENLANPRVARVARLVYFYTKVRGAKTVLRLFPHAVSDLGTLLALFSTLSVLELLPQNPTTDDKAAGPSWELRYVLLLWLSLVVMLPFSLEGVGGTAVTAGAPGSQHAIERIGLHYLKQSGKERDAAVVLLARFYSRPDSALEPFLALVETTLSSTSPPIIFVTSLLETLSALLLLCSPRILLQLFPRLYHLLALTGDAKGDLVKGKGRYRIKLVGRIALLRLTGSAVGTKSSQASAPIGEADVPEEAEVLIQELLEALSDPESTSRYSASKYLARIAALLPSEYSFQIFEALLETFDGPPEGREDAWQGGCLAIAEFCRRDLVPRDFATVERLVQCVIKALHHDVQHLSQSLGTPVRDAAAYALWSLARVLPPSFVSEAQAGTIAENLVCVTLFDREIQIRRAAGAAWQEAVGRWGLFDHGIELLSTLDFFTVGPRARAFLEASPVVATYGAYRGAIVNHLVHTTLAHYDSDMRILGAAALEKVLKLDAPVLVPPLIKDQTHALKTKDTAKLHGAILSLGALAAAADQLPEPLRQQLKTEVFSSLVDLTPPTLSANGSRLLLSGILLGIEKSCTSSNLSGDSSWWKFIEAAWKHNDETVHGQAAETVRSASGLVDLSIEVASLMAALDSRSAVQQQAATLILGQTNYETHNKLSLPPVVDRLIVFSGFAPSISPRGPPAKSGLASSIEGKRNGVEALATILCAPSNVATLGQETILSAFDVIVAGFKDYTRDQRGDVGSWVRLASIGAVGACIPALGGRLLDQKRLDQTVAALLKMGVERLDGVREAAGKTLEELVKKQTETCDFHLKGVERLQSTLSSPDAHNWRIFSWAAERLFPFFDVEEYRSALLEGTALGINPHSTGTAFLDYALALPIQSGQEEEVYSLLQLAINLYTLGKRNFSNNRLFVPCLTTLGLLFESGMMDDWTDAETAGPLKQLLQLATSSLAQIKSWPRLCASVKITICLIANPTLSSLAASKMVLFLDHPLLTLRQHAAEELYAVAIGWDGAEDLQSVLSETAWGENTEQQKAALLLCAQQLSTIFPLE